MTENNRTDAIETPTLFDDVLKTSQSASQFGALRIYRVKEIPLDDFGRNGDLALIDDTAFSSVDLASGKEPTNVGLAQKIPSMVPSGPNRGVSTINGADLIANNQFTIDKAPFSTPVTVTLPAGSVFVAQAAQAINDATIPGISASYQRTSSLGSVVNPFASPGDSIVINSVPVTFTAGGDVDYIIATINLTSIPFIIATKKGGSIFLTHDEGGTIVVGGTNVLTIFGTGTVTGGLLTIDNTDGLQVDLVDMVGTPLATMGFPTTITASSLTNGGTWRLFAAGDVAVEDTGSLVGTFDTFNFIGLGVTVTDAGGGTVSIDIPGGGGGGLPGLAITTINGQPTLTLIDTTRGNKILSVAETNFIFAEPNLADLDWFKIGDASDSTTGYITPFQATIVSASYHNSDDNGQAKELDLYINGSYDSTLFTTPGTSVENSATITNLNIDLSQGDKLQMRAGTTGTAIADTLVTLWVKWRG